MSKFEAISVNPDREVEIVQLLLEKGLREWFSIEELQQVIGVQRYTTVLIIKDSMIKHGLLKHNGKKKSGYRLAIDPDFIREVDVSQLVDPEEARRDIPLPPDSDNPEMIDPDVWRK